MFLLVYLCGLIYSIVRSFVTTTDQWLASKSANCINCCINFLRFPFLKFYIRISLFLVTVFDFTNMWCFPEALNRQLTTMFVSFLIIKFIIFWYIYMYISLYINIIYVLNKQIYIYILVQHQLTNVYYLFVFDIEDRVRMCWISVSVIREQVWLILVRKNISSNVHRAKPALWWRSRITEYRWAFVTRHEPWENLFSRF